MDRCLDLAIDDNKGLNFFVLILEKLLYVLPHFKKVK